MPVVAVDRAMRKRLKGSPVEGRARIKTGSLKNTLSIAGYIKVRHEKLWIVVALINDEKAGKARSAMDALILWISGDQGK